MATTITLAALISKEYPNPTTFKFPATTYKVGTILDPGKEYGLVIFQGKELIATGEMGEAIPLNKKRTDLKKGFFSSKVNNIHVFAVQMVYQGSNFVGDYSSYDYFAHGKNKHKNVCLGIQYAYNFLLTRTHIKDWLDFTLKGCIPMEKMKGGAIALKNYVDTCIMGYTAEYFDNYYRPDFNQLVLKAGANTMGPECDEYNKIMHEVETYVFRKLGFFSKVSNRPLSIYVSSVDYK